MNRHPLMKSEVVRLARMMSSSSASSGCRTERARMALDGSVYAGGVREREYSVEDFPPMVVFPVHKGIQVKHIFIFLDFCINATSISMIFVGNFGMQRRLQGPALLLLAGERRQPDVRGLLLQPPRTHPEADDADQTCKEDGEIGG